MAKFKVGDKIVMNRLANDRYAITKEGSYGFVTAVYEEKCECRVLFDRFKSFGRFNTRKPDYFIVKVDCMSMYYLTEDDGKTGVERKIEVMFKRQPYYEHKVMV